MSKQIVLLLVALCAIGALLSAQGPQGPQGQQSQGALRNRPGANREPEFPTPSIREYKPRSTLVVAEHPRPRAKFPAIDIHSHQPTPISAADFDRVIEGMDRNNLRVLVNNSGASGARLRQALEAIRGSRHRDRMAQFAEVDFRNVGPGWGRK